MFGTFTGTLVVPVPTWQPGHMPGPVPNIRNCQQPQVCGKKGHLPMSVPTIPHPWLPHRSWRMLTATMTTRSNKDRSGMVPWNRTIRLVQVGLDQQDCDSPHECVGGVGFYPLPLKPKVRLSYVYRSQALSIHIKACEALIFLPLVTCGLCLHWHCCWHYEHHHGLASYLKLVCYPMCETIEWAEAASAQVTRIEIYGSTPRSESHTLVTGK
jgi:hypothetical protein